MSSEQDHPTCSTKRSITAPNEGIHDNNIAYPVGETFAVGETVCVSDAGFTKYYRRPATVVKLRKEGSLVTIDAPSFSSPGEFPWQMLERCDASLQKS